MSNERMYNDPVGGTASEIGTQIRTDHYAKKALIEARKEQYFMPLADVTAMPKHFGKKIKKYHYMPLLDDRNINDQGIDAAGVALVAGEWSAINAAGQIISSGHASEAVALAVGGAVTATQDGGNLYGSSKDIGAISGKLPMLSEAGGRVNRVGFKRIELEGTIQKMGFFDEYTQESMDFDTDEDLMMHINREMVNGAVQLSEAQLQVDLLNFAGVNRFPGAATQVSEVSGENGSVTEITYEDLMRMSIDLDNNRTPKHTKMITGTRMIDTKTVQAARVLYIGSELIPTVRKMTDLHNNPAFIEVQKYAAGTTVMNGEIGAIDQFRIVVVPEMQHWAGRGAAVTTNDGYREYNGNYNVYPLLCVGDSSFTTIGFQTDGKTVKYTIYHKKPGKETADKNDPYGEMGFMSVKWYYGFLGLRSERVALAYSVAEL